MTGSTGSGFGVWIGAAVFAGSGAAGMDVTPTPGMTGFTGHFSMPRAAMGEMTGCGSGSTSGTANTGLGGSGTTFGAVRSVSTTVSATGLAGAAVGSGVISSSLMMGLTVATGGFVGLAGAAVAETFGMVGSTTGPTAGFGVTAFGLTMGPTASTDGFAGTEVFGMMSSAIGLAVGFGMAAETGFGATFGLAGAFGGRTGGMADTGPKFGMSGTGARFGCSGVTRNVTGLRSGMSVIVPPPRFRRMIGRSPFRPCSAASGWWTTGARRSRTASRPTASAPRSRACRPCRPPTCSSSS